MCINVFCYKIKVSSIFFPEGRERSTSNARVFFWGAAQELRILQSFFCGSDARNWLFLDDSSQFGTTYRSPGTSSATESSLGFGLGPHLRPEPCGRGLRQHLHHAPGHSVCPSIHAQSTECCFSFSKSGI